MWMWMWMCIAMCVSVCVYVSTAGWRCLNLCGLIKRNEEQPRAMEWRRKGMREKTRDKVIKPSRGGRNVARSRVPRATCCEDIETSEKCPEIHSVEEKRIIIWHIYHHEKGGRTAQRKRIKGTKKKKESMMGRRRTESFSTVIHYFPLGHWTSWTLSNTVCDMEIDNFGKEYYKEWSWKADSTWAQQ